MQFSAYMICWEFSIWSSIPELCLCLNQM